MAPTGTLGYECKFCFCKYGSAAGGLDALGNRHGRAGIAIKSLVIAMPNPTIIKLTRLKSIGNRRDGLINHITRSQSRHLS